MQQHNKALEEADIAEEEKRMIHEEMSRREREDLENELRSYKKQLSHSLEERDKLEELMKQSQLLNENTKAQVHLFLFFDFTDLFTILDKITL